MPQKNQGCRVRSVIRAAVFWLSFDGNRQKGIWFAQRAQRKKRSPRVVFRAKLLQICSCGSTRHGGNCEKRPAALNMSLRSQLPLRSQREPLFRHHTMQYRRAPCSALQSALLLVRFRAMMRAGLLRLLRGGRIWRCNSIRNALRASATSPGQTPAASPPSLNAPMIPRSMRCGSRAAVMARTALPATRWRGWIIAQRTRISSAIQTAAICSARCTAQGLAIWSTRRCHLIFAVMAARRRLNANAARGERSASVMDPR